MNEINKKALLELDSGNWKEAQKLFFENAKNNPSHETLNNLGYYLCTEGLTCVNGKVRDAGILGMNYLIKASKMKNSVKNFCAIATAIYEKNCMIPKNLKFFYL